jgi:hypothetical protein
MRVAGFIGLLGGGGGYFGWGRSGFRGGSSFFLLIFFEIWSKRAH